MLNQSGAVSVLVWLVGCEAVVNEAVDLSSCDQRLAVFVEGEDVGVGDGFGAAADGCEDDLLASPADTDFGVG